MVKRRTSAMLLIHPECSKMANAKNSGQRRTYCPYLANSFQNSIDVATSETCSRESLHYHHRRALQSQRRWKSEVLPHHAVVASPARSAGFKRAQKPEAAMPPAKRTKSGPQSAGTNGSGKGQQSLKGFFQARSLTTNGSNSTKDTDTVGELPPQPTTVAMPTNDSQASVSEAASSKVDVDTQREPGTASGDLNIIPTIDEASAEASKQSWGKLFSKPASPNCEHGEPCKTMLTKKPGVNCGRSFWMCNRPLGPSGSKEKNTQWRCSTFIWASDWTGTGNG
jgi:AP endonuclease-2